MTYFRPMGCGLYPSLCLLNTCCDQNMTKVYSGTSVTGLVAKMIRAGEEVSDNYFPTAVYMPRQERRDWLAEHFMFHCECQAEMSTVSCSANQKALNFNAATQKSPCLPLMIGLL